MIEHFRGVQVLCSWQLALTMPAGDAVLTVCLLKLLLQHQRLLDGAQQAGLNRCRGCHLSLGLHTAAMCCQQRSIGEVLQKECNGQ